MAKKMSIEESKKITEELISSVNEEITKALQNNDTYKEYLEEMMECHQYSINNSFLLKLKYKKNNPIAKTAKQWKAMGVNVLSGEYKNYAFLLRPSFYDGFYRNKVWVSWSKATQADKQAVERGEIIRRKGMKFARYCVYDISQTDADEETIAKEKLEAAPKTYEMEAVSKKTNMSVDEFLSCVKDEIDILARENGIYSTDMSAYKAGTSYLCGKRLGIDMNVNNFYLHKNLEKKDFNNMKKLTKLMVNDSESIIENLLLDLK